MSDIIKADELQPLAVAEMRRQVNLIQGMMKEMMHKDEHYGIIPGCKKPSLYKPGAEKLGMMFRLCPAYDITQTDLGNGHREYQVKCTLKHIAGRFIGEGVGLCSTMETKFRYRPGYEVTEDAIPADYKAKKADYKANGFGCKEIDGQWKWVHFLEGGKQENPDIADCYNTILKMAKKRAHVDAVLSATAASDIFTQDVEDLQSEVVVTSRKQPVNMPTEKAPVAQEPSGHEQAGTTELTATGTLDQVSVKKGTGKNGAWKKYGLLVNKEWYGTFDTKIGDEAVQLKEQNVYLTWKEEGKYKTVTSIAILQDTPEAVLDDLPIDD